MEAKLRPQMPWYAALHCTALGGGGGVGNQRRASDMRSQLVLESGRRASCAFANCDASPKLGASRHAKQHAPNRFPISLPFCLPAFLPLQAPAAHLTNSADLPHIASFTAR